MTTFLPLSPLGEFCTGVNRFVINCTLEDVSVITTYLTDDVKRDKDALTESLRVNYMCVLRHEGRLLENL